MHSSLAKPLESSNIANDSLRAKYYFFICISKPDTSRSGEEGTKH